MNRPYLEGLGNGATFKEVSKQIVARIEICLPPLEEQRRIAAILDQAEALRSKRRQALAKLDTLTQSLFLEMFGDPRTNNKKLPTSTIGKLLTLKSGNFLPASQMKSSGQYPVYGGNGVNGRHDEYMFDRPTISIGRVGAYCGVVHLTEQHSWITDNSLLVAQHDPALSLRYLFEALKIANLNQYSSQSGQPLISSSRLRDVQILVPNRVSQEHFARWIENKESLNNRVGQTSKLFDQVFRELQQNAFIGGL